MNPEGEHSTAELAKLLHSPVILVMDCDKVTRTAAAMILGCRHFDQSVDIRGVILNRIGGSRHAGCRAKVHRGSLRIPVLGAVPRMADIPFSERHLGLIPPQEHDRIRQALGKAADIAGDYLDLGSLTGIAESAPAWEDHAFPDLQPGDKTGREQVTIGVIRDGAFSSITLKHRSSRRQRCQGP